MPNNVARLPVGWHWLATGAFALLALAACHPLEPYQTERFDLTAGPAAAEGYPMEIVEGRFITSDGKSIPLGAEFLEGDWGLSHSGVVGGDGTAPAPDSLEVRWFSYPEDKFYEGHFLLPQKTIYDLPLEVLLLVLAYLPRFSDNLTARLVSRRFRDAAKDLSVVKVYFTVT